MWWLNLLSWVCLLGKVKLTILIQVKQTGRQGIIIKNQVITVIVYLSKVILAAVITNGPQDTMVCVNQLTIHVDLLELIQIVPKWHITKRNRNGVIVSDEIISGTAVELKL